MAYRSVAEVKQYAIQMLHQDETSPALAGSTAESRQDLAERWVTRSYEKIARFHRWPWLEETRTFAWPTGTTTTGGILYLPDYVYRIYSAYSDGYPVSIITKSSFDRSRPSSPINQGKDILVQFGHYGVEADVSAAGVLTVVTDIAANADDGLQVRLEGLTGSGNTARTLIETVTLSTSTATTTGSFSSGQGGLRRATIVPGTVPTAGGGLITVTDAGGVTLERLDSSREREHQHIRTEMHSRSGSGSTHEVSFYRRTFDITVDTDVIEMPQEFMDMMEDGIMIEMHKFMGNPEAAKMMHMQRNADLRELVAFSNQQPGTTVTLSPNMGRGQRGRVFS